MSSQVKENIEEKIENDAEKLIKFVDENYWKVRDCDLYRIEYKECSCLEGKFHQYFIHGELSDCSIWKKDFDNCKKWEEKKDYEACASIIHHEDERKEKRLNAHFANDIWKKRDKPPADWNKELPDWFLEKNKDSFWQADVEQKSFCVIS